MSRPKFAKSSLIVASLFLLAMGLAGSARGAVRFDVVGSPTEVINTGRSEVLGSVNLIVRGSGSVTGTSSGGAAQLGLSFANPTLPIDNTTHSGIRLFSSLGFAAAHPSIVSLGNHDINGRCAGFLVINLQPGATPSEGDYLRIEGIRGRIDSSIAITPGMDLFVSLQSANDPAATSFSPDRLRVATSFNGLKSKAVSTTFTFEIHITEGFARAFVDRDANGDGINGNDRLDSAGDALGAPANSTQVQIRLDGIPDGISGIEWPALSPISAAGAVLTLLSKSFSGSTSTALYSYEAANQVGGSDLVTETFVIAPGFRFSNGPCNTDRLTGSVTLAPSVAAITGCDDPSDGVARPRFLELYDLSLQRLSLSSIMAGSDGFTLGILGSGFMQGSQVLWNGSPRDALFVSGTELTAEIPSSDLAKAGTASITVANPAAQGGAVSNALTFQVQRLPLSLFYPRLMLGDPSPTGHEGTEYTGIALVNLSSREAKLKLTAFDKNGAVISGPIITNPASLSLKAGQQTPVLATEVFGSGLSEVASVGWMKVEGNVPQVAGFFLSFDGNLTRLDGADVSSTLLTSFFFPEIEEQGTTQIHIANPNEEPAVVALKLMKADGSQRVAAVKRTIGPSGTLAALVRDLFPGVTPGSSDYIQVSSDHPVAAFEYLLGTEQDSAGLNGQDVTAGSNILYCPQYVVGGQDWNTTLSVVNLSAKSSVVSFRFIADDGTQVGPAETLPIAALGKIRITDQSFFMPAGDALKQGYLEISASGIQLSGDVIFSNPIRHTFASALPLVARLRDKMIFSQVASNSTYFTGLALLNPSGYQTPVIIQVFDGNGVIQASKMEIIPPRARVSRLLTEHFPELAQKEISSGYIIVTGMRNLAAFALFGTHDLSVLSAIPAQTVP